MSRRIHIPGLSARPNYSRTRAAAAPQTDAAALSPSNADDGMTVRLAGLKHDFELAEFSEIAMNAARAAAEQGMELDMAGLLETARDFRGELASENTTVVDASEPVTEPPLVINDDDDDDILLQAPTTQDVLDED